MGKGFLCLALKNYFSRLPVLHHRDSRQLTLAGSSPITETFCHNCETGKMIVSPFSLDPALKFIFVYAILLSIFLFCL